MFARLILCRKSQQNARVLHSVPAWHLQPPNCSDSTHTHLSAKGGSQDQKTQEGPQSYSKEAPGSSYTFRDLDFHVTFPSDLSAKLLRVIFDKVILLAITLKTRCTPM
ncbi:hypothetical protein CERZMDRAFT_90477 [Cercospora zeae-maydis SCOH1-5]|uniref:Uncharacterized protein n=1 Tax=Cercospora zeae-maydis SCOH1-5 TaxID=717836 RepID=A0A6A6FJI8_9PEZI|nr:hypothetical protein CERZMDRAFT_90477 [Cercospora zeae-maydis SCOH1-5]